MDFYRLFHSLIRLQRLQNWAARLVLEVDRKQSPGPFLKSLHWFQVKGSRIGHSVKVSL